ncbi:TIGR00266 family protein [Candidatus Gracilibacteria bacterium]|nr:TIGR00266 family protein [Candidatus Gracilibacteria bacterium]
MEYEILGKPSYSCLHYKLSAGEKIKVEPGSMVAMDPTAKIVGKMEGGLLGALGRTFLTGESFFVTDIKANKDNSDIYLAPRSVGDIEKIEISEGKEWIVQGGGFLASTSEIQTNTKFEGFRGFMSGEGLFMIKVSGNGTCWVSSFGAILEYELDGTENFIVDNAHIVAFESSLNYTVKNSGNGFFSAVKNGEGLVCEFSGKGKIYFQTRNVGSFVQELNPFLSNRNASQGNDGLFGGILGG